MERGRPNSISPIFVVLLGVMSAAVVLTIYHCIVVTWCNPQRRRPRNGHHGLEGGHGDAAVVGESAEFSTVQLIPPAVKYGKEEGMVSADQTTCAVCLCDFKDGETVRLLPECLHCFHVPCIDMWLRSHTNCPMCRTETSPMLNGMHVAMLAAAPDLEGRRAANTANLLVLGTTS